MSDVEMDENGELNGQSKSFIRTFYEPSGMVFDPDQDPEEKRAVRQNYRSLTKKIEGVHIICYPFNKYVYIEFKEDQMILQQRNSCRKFRRPTSYSVGVIKLLYQSFPHIS
jgi:hypothetical protein